MQHITPKDAEVEFGIFSLTDMVPGDTGSQRVRGTMDAGDQHPEVRSGLRDHQAHGAQRPAFLENA